MTHAWAVACRMFSMVAGTDCGVMEAAASENSTSTALLKYQ
ncbi:hypothetical protein [Enterocloster clostridioformis]